MKPSLKVLRKFILITALMLLLQTLTSYAHSHDKNLGNQNISKPPLPSMLSRDDAMHYQNIFSLQDEGLWKEADLEIKKLSDPVLLGRVLFQRYMHPTKYRSSYEELASWLESYAEQPGAFRIYRLAMRRKPAAERPPRWPGAIQGSHIYRPEPTPKPTYNSLKKRNTKNKNLVSKLRQHMIEHVRRGDPAGAERHLNKREVTELFDNVEFDEIRARVAASYFFKGHDEQAFALASKSAERSRAHIPLSDWTAGIAAWRLGDTISARDHLELLAKAENISIWNKAAGAFWAARANLVTKRPQKVNAYLALAARYPRTFYGLLAARLLGDMPHLNWKISSPTPHELSQLLNYPDIRRAIALSDIGQVYWGEQEIRAAYRKINPELDDALLKLVHYIQLPAASLRIASATAKSTNRKYDATLYPLPPWEPEGGFEIDRALIYAFMRQESEFNSRAISPSGARGLMQLLPSTGSFIANDRSLQGRNKRKLYSPKFNIYLGQKYLLHLMGNKRIEDDLFKLAAAYNGGPGNLRKWLRIIDFQDDPLLFIESLPALETRLFIERVIANLWLYRQKMGQGTPSLHALAEGHWPRYIDLDPPTLNTPTAENLEHKNSILSGPSYAQN